MAVEVAERVSFEAKWRLLARVGVRCCILISNVSGAVKVAPLQKFKRWEQGNVQIFKSTWEKYFKQA